MGGEGGPSSLSQARTQLCLTLFMFSPNKVHHQESCRDTQTNADTKLLSLISVARSYLRIIYCTGGILLTKKIKGI